MLRSIGGCIVGRMGGALRGTINREMESPCDSEQDRPIPDFIIPFPDSFPKTVGVRDRLLIFNAVFFYVSLYYKTINISITTCVTITLTFFSIVARTACYTVICHLCPQKAQNQSEREPKL